MMGSITNEEESVSVQDSLFGTEYGLARAVLSNFGCKELSRMASVCQLWNQIARSLITHRTSVHWNCESQIGETFILDNFLDQFLDSIKSLPSFCVCITTAESLKYGDAKEGFGECRRHLLDTRKTDDDHSWMQLLVKRLPACPVLLVKAPGIIGTDCQNRILEYEHSLWIMEIEESVEFTILLFPNMADVAVTPFVFSKLEIKNGLKGIDSKEDLLEIIHLPKDTCPKAVLLFTNAKAYRFITNLSEKISSYFDNKVAIGGGFIDHSVLLPLSSGHACPRISGLVFHGEGVQAASLVLASQEKADVEAKIKEFKERQMPEEKSVCFMFASVERGYGLFREEGYETRIFRKYFPKTPVFGLFGREEIGIDCFPPTEEEEKKLKFQSGADTRNKKMKTGLEFTHGSTTILVFVSFVKK